MIRWAGWLLWLGCLARLGVCAQPLLINELVTSNDTGLSDEDGDRPDWIELYNPGTAAINLQGYGLTDEVKSPFKWRFPLRLIPARGFVVVFASGKNRTNANSLHTNFRLSAAGETVRLTRPDGRTTDEVGVPALLKDVAYGRQPDGGSALFYLATPTPGALNHSVAGTAALSPPLFSAPAGFGATNLSLELRAPDPGAVIHYTLDGSEPTTASPVYEAPLLVVNRSSQSNELSVIPGTSTNNQHTDGWKPPRGLVRKATFVRAASFRAGALPSRSVGQTFFVGPRPPTGLPVISLSLAPAELFDFDRGLYMLGRIFVDWRRDHPTEPLTGHTPANYTQRGPDWERAAHFEYFSPDGTPAVVRDIRLDIQGQSSRSFRQKSLGLKVAGNPIQYELFPGLRRHGDGTPLQEFRHLRLRNSGNDWAYTLFRDALCHRLAEGLLVDTQAYQPVEVFLDGEYWGVHNLREQRDADYYQSHYGVPRAATVICFSDGSLVEGVAGGNEPFIKLREFAGSHDLAVAENYAVVARQIDVRNFILYHAACIYFGNADWPHNNLEVWRDRTGPVDGGAVYPRDGRWRWVLFDCDLAYAHPWSGGVGDATLAAALSPTGRPEVGVDLGWSTVLFRSLLKNPEFRREFLNTSADLMNSWFRETRAAGTVEKLRAAIAPAMTEHLDRWQTQSGTNAWAAQVKILTSFANQRPILLRQQYVTQFHLAGYGPLTVDVIPAEAGRVRVNHLWINADLPGVAAVPYPWHGWYFRGVPVEVEAQPAAGWQFAGWEFDDGTSVSGAEAAVQRILPEAVSQVRARFTRTRPTLGPITWVAKNRWSVTVRGAPDHSYQVQSSVDLTTWLAVGSVLTDAQGQARVEREAPPDRGSDFLRLRAAE